MPLVDMRSPGITVRPLVQLTGDAEFNEVFLDDVRVPQNHLLGPLHAGWKVAITVLMYERTGLGNQTTFTTSRGACSTSPADDPKRRTGVEGPGGAQALAQCWIETGDLRLTSLRSLTRRLRGERPGPKASVLKLAYSEAYVRMAETASGLLGVADSCGGERRPRPTAAAGPSRRCSPGASRSRADVQIQRNIIGDRVLGPPRS